MAHYQAILEYDGTGFLGFQRQRTGRTVQGELETALRQIGWPGASVLAGGRTDTGVHAAGQVVAFEFDWKHSPADLLRAVNANLPPDAAVKAVAECAPGFHPRYSAKGRHYRYTLYAAPVRAPLLGRHAWQVPVPLALAPMQAASRQLLGRHDFAAFGDDPDEGHNTVRTVSRADWSLGPGPGRLDFDIQAEAFLHRMVRSLVGALKRVGEGSLTVEEFGAILESRDRARCPAVAPPQGLCLMEIMY